jgi:hypothetical protein
MAKLTYRCTNYNECDKADDREIISLEQGEEIICPECKRPLQPEPPGGEPPPNGRRKFLLVTVGGAIVIAASAAGFLIFKPAPPPAVTVESCLQEVWPWLK